MAAALALLSAPALAQQVLHVSTTSNLTVGSIVDFDDAGLLTVGDTGGPLVHYTGGHWQGVAGWVPSDVDAFARKPGAVPGSADSFVFSIQANEGGYLDGDVLGLAPGGGLEVLVPEATLLAKLGVPGENIDIDALDFGDSGCLFFSLQNDLPGTVFGTVQDGDILCWDASWNQIGLTMTEQDVQAKFTLATGSTAAIGDVIALDEVNGQLWIVPQSPSQYDGAVIGVGSSAQLLMDEVDVGLGGAEIDALSLARPGDLIPSFHFDLEAGGPGAAVNVTLHGAPNAAYVALMSGGTGWIDFSRRPGFGAFYFDPLDPWLNTMLGQPGPVYAMTDPAGNFSASWQLPTGAVHGIGFQGEEGWSFQVFEVPGLTVSAPFRIQKL